MKDNNIYILFSCDIWKSTNSMRLKMASTNPDNLLNYIRKGIEEQNYAYHGEEQTVDEQLSFFDSDISKGIEKIEKKLMYGYIRIVEDGEEA